MIAYITMSYEYEGGQSGFIDFEDLSNEVIGIILGICNFHKERASSDWEIEATFPEGHVPNLGHWVGLLEPEHFFTYLRYGRKRPDLPGASMKTDGSLPKYTEIVPISTAFERLPLKLLERLAVAFREYLDDDEYDHLEDDSEVTFTPLFEKEVEARR